MSKATKALGELMAISAILNPDYSTSAYIPNEAFVDKQKERTIRKCADPKKKAKRKMAQASKRRNRM
jgi:hypothetical protein